MSYEFYNIIHVIGVVVLFTALGALAGAAGSERRPLRTVATVAYWIALAVIFIAGFGLLARLGHFGAIPLWAYMKMVLWAILAVMTVLIRRRPEWAPRLALTAPIVGAVAIWFAVSQPF